MPIKKKKRYQPKFTKKEIDSGVIISCIAMVIQGLISLDIYRFLLFSSTSLMFSVIFNYTKGNLWKSFLIFGCILISMMLYIPYYN